MPLHARRPGAMIRGGGLNPQSVAEGFRDALFESAIRATARLPPSARRPRPTLPTARFQTGPQRRAPKRRRRHQNHTSSHTTPVLLECTCESPRETRGSAGTLPSHPCAALKLLQRLIRHAETGAARLADADRDRSHPSCQPHRADFADGSGWNEIAGVEGECPRVRHQRRTFNRCKAVCNPSPRWIRGRLGRRGADRRSELGYSAKLSLNNAPGRRSRSRLTTSGPAIPS